MKRMVACILACLALASAYTDIDETYNYEAVLKNTTLLEDFLGCFLDKNPCSDVEQHIKNHLHDVVVTLCAKCDDFQRHYARAMDTVMRQKYPEDYEKYKTKYDPEGNHYAKFLKAISKY